MTKVTEVVRYLHAPQTVARFQKFCGLEILKSDACIHNGQGTAHTGSNGASSVHSYENITSDLRGIDLADGVESLKQNGSSINKETAFRQRSSNGVTTITNGSPKNSIPLHAFPSLAKSAGSVSVQNDGASDYVVHHRLLDLLFHFGAQLGNEIFYITFFPFWFWNIDGYVGRRILMFWCIFMYAGQALKDVLKIPRPAAPPVVRLERRYALEYGMPSTHAMVGAGMPFSIYFLTVERYTYESEWMLLAAIIWCSIVCCSRIYLGMHSILDVLVGLALVFLLMLLLPVLDHVDYFVLHSVYSPLACILIPLGACFAYPTPLPGNTARGDTTLIVAVGAGISIGHWISYTYGLMAKSVTAPPYDIIQPTWTWALLVVVRMSIGVTFLVVLRAILKAVVRSFVTRLTAAAISTREEKTENGEEKTGNGNGKDGTLPWSVEMPTKFVTYSTLSAACIIFVPMAFRSLGIERETYFTEI